jgi:flagellin-like protein
MTSYWLNIVNSKILDIGEVQIMRSIFKSKKGISPILATLLLIVIAVAAVIVTYAWVMTFTSSTTGQAGAILSPENIRFYSADDIEITIRNSGTADAKIAEVYEGPSNSELQKADVRDYDPDTQIVSEGSSITIDVRLEDDWESGTRYYFKVVTEEGYNLPFSEVAP